MALPKQWTVMQVYAPKREMDTWKRYAIAKHITLSGLVRSIVNLVVAAGGEPPVIPPSKRKRFRGRKLNV